LGTQVGTLTPGVAAAVREMRRGRVEFKMGRTAIVHAPIGKVRVFGVVGGGGVALRGLSSRVWKARREVQLWPPFSLLSSSKTANP